jgi:MFS transporter, DHA1 family, multidrug resistance protein
MPPAPRSAHGPPLALLLAAISSIGPFAIDTYLPSFSDIGSSLGANQLEVQQTLTAYMLPFALMTLWHGAIADALGRRRVILGGMLIFCLGSLGCALAPNIQILWLFRALQGATAGAGMVVGRAVVRDLLNGVEAQRLMSRVTMTFAVAPAIAPILGGWLAAHLGWRSVFVFLVVISLAVSAWCYRALPETLPRDQRQPLHARYLLRAYREVLTDPAFVCGSLGTAAAFSAFFIYVMSAPVYLMQHLGLGQTEFVWLFGPATAGMMLGSWYSSHTAGRLERAQIVLLGYGLMALGAAFNLALSAYAEPRVPWSVVPHFVFVLGMAMTAPTLTLMGLDLFPARRGLAASCQGLIATGAHVFNSALLAPALWASPLRLALGQCALLATAACSVACFFWLLPRPTAEPVRSGATERDNSATEDPG